jgi:hypothetical protein
MRLNVRLMMLRKTPLTNPKSERVLISLQEARSADIQFTDPA